VLPDGRKFSGPAQLKAILKQQQDLFVKNLAQQLLTYGLGRGLEAYDRPVVRTILRQAAPDNYKISSLIMGVVQSTPFQMRRTPEP